MVWVLNVWSNAGRRSGEDRVAIFRVEFAGRNFKKMGGNFSVSGFEQLLRSRLPFFLKNARRNCSDFVCGHLFIQ